MIKAISLTLLSTALVFALTACETDEDNKIASALQCLDEISGSGTSAQKEAENCYDEVDGINSSDASYVRCVAIYNMRGLFTSDFIDAYKQLSDPDGSNNSALEMISVVSFSGTNTYTGNTAVEDAEEVLDECDNADSKGHTMLAASTLIGTKIGALTTGTSLAELDAYLDANSPLSGDAAEELGDAAQSAWDVYCDGKSSSSNEFCQALEDAGADDGLSSEELGAALSNLLKDPN